MVNWSDGQLTNNSDMISVVSEKVDQPSFEQTEERHGQDQHH